MVRRCCSPFETSAVPKLIASRLLTLIACLLGHMVPGHAEDWSVGTASTIVTPPTGQLMAGYGRDRRSTGQYDDLFAKVVMIRDSQTQIGLVTIDNIGLTRPDIERIGLLAAKAIPGFEADHLVISSTHTHAGPDVVGLWGESLWSSGRDEGYMNSLYQRVIKALIKADKNAVPVTSRVGSRHVKMNWVVNRSEPELLDQTLSVLQFIDKNGNSLATLTNFACHPTVLDGENTKVSSDYVGGFYQAMAQALPGEHLFLQGAIGGWVQPLLSVGDPDHGDIEDARLMGEELAQASLDLIANSDANAARPLEFKSKTFAIELENWGFRLMMWLGVLERETIDGAMQTAVAWFKIGDAQFVTHPGETSPAYSLASRELMNTSYGFVLGLTQDALGYILKPDYFVEDVTYPHAEYLQSVSVGPEAGPELMRALGELVLTSGETNTR